MMITCQECGSTTEDVRMLAVDMGIEDPICCETSL